MSRCPDEMQRKKKAQPTTKKMRSAVGIFQGVQVGKSAGAEGCGLSFSKYSKNFGGDEGIGKNEVQLPKLPALKG